MQEAVRLPRAGIFEINDRLKLLNRTFPTILINGKNIMTKAKFEFEKLLNYIYIIYNLYMELVRFSHCKVFSDVNA